MCNIQQFRTINESWPNLRDKMYLWKVRSWCLTHPHLCSVSYFGLAFFIRKLQVNAKLSGYTACYFSRLHCTSWPAQWETWGRGGSKTTWTTTMRDWPRAARLEHAAWKCKDLRPTRQHLWLAGRLTRLARLSASCPQTDRKTNWLTSGSVSRPGQVLSRYAADKFKRDTFPECVSSEQGVSLRHPRIQSLLMWHRPLVGGGADVLLANSREERLA